MSTKGAQVALAAAGIFGMGMVEWEARLGGPDGPVIEIFGPGEDPAMNFGNPADDNFFGVDRRDLSDLRSHPYANDRPPW